MENTQTSKENSKVMLFHVLDEINKNQKIIFNTTELVDIGAYEGSLLNLFLKETKIIDKEGLLLVPVQNKDQFLKTFRAWIKERRDVQKYLRTMLDLKDKKDGERALFALIEELKNNGEFLATQKDLAKKRIPYRCYIKSFLKHNKWLDQNNKLAKPIQDTSHLVDQIIRYGYNKSKRDNKSREEESSTSNFLGKKIPFDDISHLNYQDVMSEFKRLLAELRARGCEVVVQVVETEIIKHTREL